MNKTSIDGGPAFPTLGEVNGREVVGSDGMSLRDYFASKAMQAIIGNQVDATMDAMASRAYAVADAMLAARKVK